LTDDLLSVAEAAEYAHVHKDTIHHWFRDGLRRLQPNGPYGVIRIRTADLRVFMERGHPERRAAKVSRGSEALDQSGEGNA
jgi:excisionase family DNA binding protein